MKVLVTNYTFDASAQTVTFTDYNPIVLERVLLITNVTDGIIIYQFNAPAKGATAATNVLTLEYDTTAMSDSDDLQIWYEDTTIETPLTDTELRATAVDVNVTGGSITVGTVEITNDVGNPIPVNGTVSVNEPVSIDDNGGSITVDGPLTDVQLRATPVPVSGTVSVTEPVSVDDNGGSLTVDNAALGVTGGGAEATALRVTVASDSTGVLSVDDNGGSLTVDNAALAVTGGGVEASALRVTIANDSTGVVSVDDNGSTLSVDDGGGSLTVDGTVAVTDGGGSITVDGSVSVSSSALPTGAATLAEQQSQTTSLQLIDDAVYTDGTGTPSKAIGIAGTDGTNPQIIKTDAAGELQVDVLTMPVVAVTQSGTWDEVGINDSGNSITVDDGGTTLSIDDGGASITVDGTVGVSGTVTVGDGGSTISVDDGGSSLTVDGTVTATLAATVTEDAASSGGESSLLIAGVRNDAAASKTTTDGDFGNIAIDAAGRVGIADLGGSISVDDNGSTLSVDDGGSSLTVDGTVAATQSGTWTEANSGSIKTAVELIDDTVYTDGTGTVSKGIAIFGQDGTNPQAIKTDSSGELQVDVLTMPTTTVQATNLDIRDIDAATDDIAVHGDVGILDQFDLTNSNPAAVAIVDGNGDQITSFGGGTQYTEDAAAAADPVGTVPILVRKDTPAAITSTDGDNVAQRGTNYGAAYVTLLDTGGSPVSVGGGTQYTEGDTDASITGTAMLMEGAANALVPAQGTAADGLLVNLGANNDVTVTGTVAVTQSGTWDEVGINDSGNSITVDDGGTTLSIDDGGSSVTVDNGGTFVTQENGAALTSLQLLDDAIKTDDAAFSPATDKVMMAGFEYDDTTPDSVNEGDAGAARMSANRNQYVQIRDNAGNERGLNIDANGEIQISGSRNAISVNSHAVTNAGTFVVQENGAALTALQLIDDIVATDDTSTHSTGSTKGAVIMAAATPTDASVNANDLGAVAMTTDRKLHVAVMDALPAGTAAIGKLAANSGVDIGDVDITSIIPGTGATNLGKAEDVAHNTGDTGVFILGVSNEANTARCADGDYSAIATDTEGNTRVVGNRDHDAVDAGEPVKVGQKAIAHGANPTAVAAADRTDWYANRAGIPFVIGGHPNIVSGEYYTTAAQTDDNILPAISTGTIYVITGITVTASAANTVSPSVRIGFGSSTVPTQGASGADAVSKVILSHPGIPAGSGVVKGNAGGIVGIGGDGEELRITCSAPTTGSLIVQVDYYTISS